MAPTPLTRPKKIKKHPNAFIRHQSDRFMRMAPSWRRPKGIDSSQRRRFKGTAKMPRIGYGTAQKTKFRRPDGFLDFKVTCPGDLELLLMHNRKYAATLAANLSIRTREAIVERADQLNVKVTNGYARLRTEEAE